MAAEGRIVSKVSESSIVVIPTVHHPNSSISDQTAIRPSAATPQNRQLANQRNANDAKSVTVK
ncbi:MAG: hypothetical protein GY694_22310 [Gammaproteobacteria bacterium]|nr:hypothetical protein [Gammaproteobacteria bacterium]